MLMVFDLLTELDKELIESYRNTFAKNYDGSDPARIERLLAPWNEAKSEYLESIFGDKLIITKPVEFKEDVWDIQERMSELVGSDSRIWEFRNNLVQIYNQRCEYSSWNDPKTKQRNFVDSLFYCDCLAANKVKEGYFETGSNVFELPIGDNILKVQRGMKPMRIISKIANTYKIGITPDENGITDLEYFRRKHSLGLNQKLLKGNLCLSIHPLDYMTMSDNDEGWESCMSWRNDGEYKQGTVEMMNSPCVVVGYLSSENNSMFWNRKETCCWNSKKWRSLFIVDKDFIINVRSYPYDNDNLVKTVITELSELAGWGRQEPSSYVYFEDWDNYRRNKNPMELNGRKIAIDFCTQAMYNDFGTGHYIVTNPNTTNDIINYSYMYSGKSECVWCGETDSMYVGVNNGESQLHCLKCNPGFWCDGCDERVDGDNYYITREGYKLCEYCWENYTETDVTNGEVYYRDNMREIYLSAKRNEPDITGAASVWVYEDNIGSDDWNKLFNIAAPRVAKRNNWCENYYVLIEDCTEEVLKDDFELYDQDDIKDYFGENEPN